MPLVLLALLLSFWIFQPIDANAGSEAFSGNEMLVKCRAALVVIEKGEQAPLPTTEIIDAGVCVQYILGYIDGHNNAAWIAAMKQKKGNAAKSDIRGNSSFCVPDNITRPQILRIYVKYLDNHPELLHYGAGSLLSFALAESFSCINK